VILIRINLKRQLVHSQAVWMRSREIFHWIERTNLEDNFEEENLEYHWNKIRDPSNELELASMIAEYYHLDASSLKVLREDPEYMKEQEKVKYLSPEESKMTKRHMPKLKIFKQYGIMMDFLRELRGFMT
jgi:hypothetical protein